MKIKAMEIFQTSEETVDKTAHKSHLSIAQRSAATSFKGWKTNFQSDEKKNTKRKKKCWEKVRRRKKAKPKIWTLLKVRKTVCIRFLLLQFPDANIVIHDKGDNAILRMIHSDFIPIFPEDVCKYRCENIFRFVAMSGGTLKNYRTGINFLPLLLRTFGLKWNL